MSKLNTIVQDAFALLAEYKLYSQKDIVEKLTVLNVKVSTPSFSLILKNKTVSTKMLTTVSEGIQSIVYKELGYKYQENGFVEQKEASWEEEIIPIEKEDIKGFKFYDEGRLSLEQKVAFMATAEKEVIELGVTLHTFTNYFLSRKDSEFKDPILNLLKRGVNFKCYLLNPNHSEASLYFNDRKTALPDESNSIEKIKNSILKLEEIKTEIAEKKFKGSFEVYTYRHIPNNYFLSIDGGKPKGKMMVSHYLYATRRAKCPVFEFNNIYNHSLYKRYWNSLKHTIDGAKLI